MIRRRVNFLFFDAVVLGFHFTSAFGAYVCLPPPSSDMSIWCLLSSSTISFFYFSTLSFCCLLSARVSLGFICAHSRWVFRDVCCSLWLQRNRLQGRSAMGEKVLLLLFFYIFCWEPLIILFLILSYALFLFYFFAFSRMWTPSTILRTTESSTCWISATWTAGNSVSKHSNVDSDWKRQSDPLL